MNLKRIARGLHEVRVRKEAREKVARQVSAFSERDREAARVLAGYLETRGAELEAERDDYERRWLAECRAHGETKRRLMLAHHELGEHSLCDGDCSR